MNPSEYDDLATTLTRELHQQVDTMGSTLGVGDVQRRARSIRRRRTASAVAGTAAAVALIVPAISLLDHTAGHRVTPAPAPTTSSTPVHLPPPGVLDVSSLPTGAPPKMAYLGPGSSERPFAPFWPSSFVRLPDGTDVVQMNNEGDFEVAVTAPDGSHAYPFPSEPGLAVDASGSVVAWTRPDGRVAVWQAGFTKPRILPGRVMGSDLRIATVNTDDCSHFCDVYVNARDAHGSLQPWEVTDQTASRLRDGDYLAVNDTSADGLSIGYRKLTDSGSCSTLLGGGEFHGFTTCRHTLASFSPDGKLILADPAYHDGIGNGVIGMYALDGKLLWERHSTVKSQAFYPEAQWEDNTHLLAPVVQDGRWAVVRFASDGSMEYAVPPVKGAAEENPFVLATS